MTKLLLIGFVLGFIVGVYAVRKFPILPDTLDALYGRYEAWQHSRIDMSYEALHNGH